MESAGVVQALQLIDQNKNFNVAALNTVLEGIKDANKDYYIAAIIGGQNSGKSTLLNYMFKTNFKTLEGTAGTRTTRGVVLGRDYEQKLIVMDVEGNDSWQNHVCGDQSYEKMVSSFALVSANILIVNIFLKQLGQQEGSQYSTLQTVLRICIDQFKQQSPKTILFCLRDANPNYFNEAQYRLKLQNDINKLWKDVWQGTKRQEQFKKYEHSPERFFTLELAFLRQYDKDYPEDFIEDVQTLRNRFIDPNSEGYLFKRQNRDHNIPANDLPLLLQNIWTTLVNNRELHLPNEKIQVANYRCEQISNDLEAKYSKDLDEKAEEVKNYGQFLDDIRGQFAFLTLRYGKSISEEWSNSLLERFKTRINVIVMRLLEKQQQIIQQNYYKMINERIFYEQKQEESQGLSFLNIHNPFKSTKEALTFVDEASKYHKEAIENFISILREINYEVPDRKERINSLEDQLKKLTEEQIKEKTQDILEQFNKEGERQMRLLAAKVLKQNLDLKFWSSTYEQYRKVADPMIGDLKNKLFWAKGEYPSAKELDEAETKMYDWIVGQLKNQFEKHLVQRLFTFFKQHFHHDQHNHSYNFNGMDQSKITDIYAEAKEMTDKLLDALNNFQFKLLKRASFINEQDFGDEIKPFLEGHKFINIREQVERRQSEEYYTVLRRKNQATSKKVPWYFILIVLFFCYDDIPAPDENALLYKLAAFVLVLGAIPLAFGQGQIIQQMMNLFGEMIGKGFRRFRGN